MAKTRDMLTVDEAAERARVHRHTLIKEIRKRRAPGTKVGGQWRIPLAAFEAYLRGEYDGARGAA